MIKMIKLYNSNLKLLSDDEFKVSHKKVSKMTIRLFLAMLLFMICLAMIHNYLLPSVPDWIVDIVGYSSAVPPFIFSIKWMMHDEEYRKRTRHLPPAFEHDQKAYDQIQKITQIAALVLVIGVLVMLIVERFIYELGDIFLLLAVCFLTISFLLMHIHGLRNLIRRRYVSNNPEEQNANDIDK